MDDELFLSILYINFGRPPCAAMWYNMLATRVFFRCSRITPHLHQGGAATAASAASALQVRVYCAAANTIHLPPPPYCLPVFCVPVLWFLSRQRPRLFELARRGQRQVRVQRPLRRRHRRPEVPPALPPALGPRQVGSLRPRLVHGHPRVVARAVLRFLPRLPRGLRLDGPAPGAVEPARVVHQERVLVQVLLLVRDALAVGIEHPFEFFSRPPAERPVAAG
mmetsp:Transcript_21665/g.34727  ORF Transcript_21665/g.34727 Transcript_21665/m.34727 type:complete len:222 (+) Transcript_21665:67-732(+)